jgi:uncharacterized protein
VEWLDLWPYVVIGFLAQMFDGTLGMGFGVISYTVLTAMGYPKEVVSASVNGAKMFTGSLSSLAHLYHRNIDWRMFGLLALGGVIGAVLGALALVKLPHDWMNPVIYSYLMLVGVIILWRAYHAVHSHGGPAKVIGIGGAGGVLEALSGVWGPLVTSNLVAIGLTPRFVVGSVTVAETVVAVTVFVILVGSLGWDVVTHSVFGLMIGAAMAAPIAARFTRTLPKRTLMVAVGLLVLLTSSYRLITYLLG